MCLRPIQVRIHSVSFDVDRSVEVPCGKCIECLKRRQNDWKLRICHECGFWKHVYFFTLTYRDSALPANVVYPDVCDEILFQGRLPECKSIAQRLDACVKSTTYVKDVQDFIKRIRTDYERKFDIPLLMKYFVCSEYGPNPNGTKRPHYHGIFMTDAEYNDLKPYFNSWSNDYGRIDFVEVGINREDKSAVANYISKYCCKGGFESRAEDISHGHCSRAWSVMSKNIGLRWINQRKNDWLKHAPISVSIDGSWNEEMLETRFSRDPDFAERIFSEIDRIIENRFISDGEYRYAIPRYYHERIFCQLKELDNFKSTDKYDLRICPTELWRFCEPQLQSFFEVFNGYDRSTSLALYRSPEPITYVTQVSKVKRYVSESFISVALAYRLRMLALARLYRDFQAVTGYEMDNAPSSAFAQFKAYQENSSMAREQIATSRLYGFYNTNMWKNRGLDFDLDFFTNDLFAL